MLVLERYWRKINVSLKEYEKLSEEVLKLLREQGLGIDARTEIGMFQLASITSVLKTVTGSVYQEFKKM